MRARQGRDGDAATGYRGGGGPAQLGTVVSCLAARAARPPQGDTPEDAVAVRRSNDALHPDVLEPAPGVEEDDGIVRADVAALAEELDGGGGGGALGGAEDTRVAADEGRPAAHLVVGDGDGRAAGLADGAQHQEVAHGARDAQPRGVGVRLLPRRGGVLPGLPGADDGRAPG